MSKRLVILVVLSLILATFGMTTGCALFNSDSTPQNPPENEASQSTPIVDERSDTEQVIDTVFTFIVLSSENSGKDIFEIEQNEWDYWYGGYNNYRQFAYGEDDDESISEGYTIIKHLRNCYEQEDDGKAEYNLPTIQDNYAVFDVTLTRARLIDTKKNVFRFNLKKDSNVGWGITDIRLIETEEDRTQPWIPD